jgi:hypothetical protein
MIAKSSAGGKPRNYTPGRRSTIFVFEATSYPKEEIKA